MSFLIMADLFGNSNCPSPSLESEDMSSFLHNLLHNSTNTISPSPHASSSFKAKHHQMHLPSSSSLQLPVTADETGSSTAGLLRLSTAFLFDSDCRLEDGGGRSSAVANSSSDHDFSDPGGYARNSFFSAADTDAIISSAKRHKFPHEYDVDEFGFGHEESKASDMPANSAPPRSSKRTRAAEIHNLSEKRRRSKINEKLKALQNLIPNSNKTDKASMLDGAIDYLKQLQLQVQMLTMRNGLSLLPVYLPETLQPLQIPQSGVDFDERNGVLNPNRGNPLAGKQELSAPTAFYISNHTPQSQPIDIPSVANVTNSNTLFHLEPIQNSYGLLNHLTSSKEICRVDSPSQLQLDISCSGKNSSSGVS